jgi:ubiquinone/menaquinone biosynthesis C-methylase UbiE
MLQRIVNEKPDAFVMGSDIVYQPLLNLAEKMPNVPLMRFDLTQCPLPDNCCDAVVILNVLEHIEDDQKALNEIYRILKPGGIVVIEVPAGPHLYDVYDKALMHFRRYTMGDLTTKIKKSGFNIKSKSHLGFLLYPGFAFVKKRNQRFLTHTIEEQRKMALKNSDDTSGNKLFHALMKLEFVLGKWVRYPWGIRCLVTCQK